MRRYSLGVFIALLLIFLPVEAQSPPQDESLPIIDVHTHTAFKRSADSPTEDQYFKEWREAGIVGAGRHRFHEGKTKVRRSTHDR